MRAVTETQVPQPPGFYVATKQFLFQARTETGLLCSQSSPQKEREREHQRARSEVKPRCPIRVCRDRPVIQRPVILIRSLCGHLASPGGFAGVAAAAISSAGRAPAAAHEGVASVHDWSKGHRVRGAIPG